VGLFYLSANHIKFTYLIKLNENLTPNGTLTGVGSIKKGLHSL